MRVRLDHKRLQELIARSGISQNHWAMKLSLSRGHWSDIVNGKHPYPSAKTRERILELFSVPFEELFETETGGPHDQDFRAAISDRYLIDRELGQGGMGTVYLARDVKLGRQVALKVISPEAVSGIGVQQFLKESRYTARLQHHHVLPLHDAGEAAGYPYYVMPYIRDGSLRDLLKRKKRLSVDETLRIAKGVAAALTYAHGQHVLHCDVKPANVLLSGDHAFVADFGISRAIHAEAFEWGKPSGLDTSAGTPAYVSPEQACGERNLDARSDVYSFASMVFEMLAGRPPFTGTSTMAIVAHRFSSEVPDLKELVPEIPVRVAGVLKKGMALDAARRYSSAADFFTALEGGAAHHVSRAREALSLVGSRLLAPRARSLSGSTALSGRVTPAVQIRHKVRQVLGSIKQDITYALRTFVRAPAFSLVVILTLAFGLAANTLVFSLMNPYFFRPLPFRNADRLVQLGHVSLDRGWDGFRFSLPQLEDYRVRSNAFEDLGAYHYGSGNLTGDEGPERVSVAQVTVNMFSVLGADAELGRTFAPDEVPELGEPAVVMDHGLWLTRYGGDAEIVGKAITLDGMTRTVIGVMSERFVFPFGGIDLWEPITTHPAQIERDRMGSLIVGRLKPEWSIKSAREELNAIFREFESLYPTADGMYDGISVKPIREALNFAWDILRAMFLVMSGAVAFALVIVCVNVASLHLARGTARAGEVAVRTALGAGRGRLVRQFLTESALLALLGGALAVLIARWCANLIWPLIPEDLYRIGEATIDAKALMFSLGVTAVAVLLFGLAPAFTTTRTDLSAALKEGGRAGWGKSAQRARRALAVFEIAMAVALVSGMGLMLRSLHTIRQVNLGFASEPVVTFAITPPTSDYPATADVHAYFDQAVTEVRTVAGVRTAATAARLPQNHEEFSTGVAPLGEMPATPDDWRRAVVNAVSPGYFDAMNIRVLAGRDFDSGDDAGTAPVVIVNEALAASYWPDEDPIGQAALVGDPDDPEDLLTATVIGVVGNVMFEAGFSGQARPQVYRSLNQRESRRRFLVVAAHDSPAAIVHPVRQALLRVDANLPSTARTMEEIVGQNALPWSLSSALLAVLGSAALVLATLGIYGVIAYSAAQRKREIAVRTALGATGAVIRRMFLTEGLRLCALGAGLGLVLSTLMGWASASVLIGVTPLDAPTLVGALLVILIVAAVASLLPAVRASRSNALEVLRHE